MIIDITTKSGCSKPTAQCRCMAATTIRSNRALPMAARTMPHTIWYRTTIATKRSGAASAWVQHYGHVATCFRYWQGVRLGRQVAKGIILLPLAGTTPSVVPTRGEARSGPPTASKEHLSDQHFEIGQAALQRRQRHDVAEPVALIVVRLEQVNAAYDTVATCRSKPDACIPDVPEAIVNPHVFGVRQRGCLQLNLSLLLVQQPRGSPPD